MIEVRVKDIADINQHSLDETTDGESLISYVDISAVDSSGNISIPKEDIKFSDAPSRARRLAPPGAVVVSTVRTYLRAIATVPRTDRKLVFSTGFAVLEARPNIDHRFLGHLCRSNNFVDEVSARSVGVSYPAINPSDIGSIKLQIPSLEEQRRIADFLDAETSRIERLLRAKDAQVQAINEHREASISTMTEQLFEEFGSVPLRWIKERIEQGWSPQCHDIEANPDEWAVLKTSAVSTGRFRPTEHKRLPPGMAPMTRYQVCDGDILMTRGSGSPAHVGVAVVARPRGRKLLLSDLLYRVRLAPGWSSDFVVVILRSRPVRSQVQLLLRGQSGQTIKLRTEDVGAIEVPRVPLTMQPNIAERMAQIESEHDVASRAIERSIALLAERRQALITAAVTGQFDVSTASGRNTIQGV